MAELRFITSVKMDTKKVGLEHIVEVLWEEPGAAGKSSVAEMVALIDSAPGSVFVTGGGRSVEVTVVREPGKAPYLRTKPDKISADNLLSLPRY